MDREKNQGLQSARAVAALSVAYFHSYVAVRGFPESAATPIPFLQQRGYLGVDLFFAVSGYVICLVASRPGFSQTTFVIKRLFRLYPMYWVVMAIVAILAIRGQYNVGSLGHFLYSMTLLPQQGAPAYDFSWTLEREIVFYALAAIAVPTIGIRGLALVLFLLAAGGWFFNEPWTFHLVSFKQADFLAGVLVFIWRDRIARIGWIAPLLTGACFLYLTQSRPDPSDLWRPIAMLIILAGLVNLDLPWTKLPFRWLIAAGDASYSIYLIHYIVFYFATLASLFVFLRVPALRQNWLCEPYRLIAITMACILARFSWKLVEVPMINLGNRLAQRWKLGRQLIASPNVTEA